LTFNNIKDMGDIYEREITLARDMTRWSLNGKDKNIYTYWLLKNGNFMKGKKILKNVTFE